MCRRSGPAGKTQNHNAKTKPDQIISDKTRKEHYLSQDASTQKQIIGNVFAHDVSRCFGGHDSIPSLSSGRNVPRDGGCKRLHAFSFVKLFVKGMDVHRQFQPRVTGHVPQIRLPFFLALFDDTGRDHHHGRFFNVKRIDGRNAVVDVLQHGPVKLNLVVRDPHRVPGFFGGLGEPLAQNFT